MQRQGSFAEAEYAGKKKQTRRDKFLTEMDQVVPWARLVARLQPLYPKGERGRPPIGLERMLRIYFLQQWYALADEAAATAQQPLRWVADQCGLPGVELIRPDATRRLDPMAISPASPIACAAPASRSCCVAEAPAAPPATLPASRA